MSELVRRTAFQALTLVATKVDVDELRKDQKGGPIFWSS